MASARQTPEGIHGLQTLVRNIVSDIVGENSSTSGTRNANLPPSNVGPVDGQSSVTDGQSSVTQELHARFGVPRQVYSPLQNYGRSREPRRRNRRQTYLTNPCTSNTRAPQTVSKSDFYIKNVILLPAPSYNTVPRGDSKSYLISRGLMIDAFEIDKKWEQEELIARLHELFKNVLLNESQSVVK